MDESISVYCKAQSKINTIERETEERRRTLNERIKTCRNILHDEMRRRGITCAEVFEGDEPVYLRLKPCVQSGPVRSEDVLRLLDSMNDKSLEILAEKCEYQLPKMVAEFVNLALKDERRKGEEGDKNCSTTLSISKAKERNFVKSDDFDEEMKNMACDFLHARSEMSQLRMEQGKQKKECKEEQKRVEETVKKALKHKDPDTLTHKVHMVQDDGDWIYYLKCHDKQENKSVGLRKAIPLIENCVVKCLEENGLPKEYSASTLNSKRFIEVLRNMLVEEFKIIESEMVDKSKITFHRGAPRKRKLV